MNTRLQAEIEIIKNNLNTLPKNNKTNLQKYNDYLIEVYNKYNGLLVKLEEEIKARFYSLFPNSNYEKIKKLKSEVESFNVHILFNDYKNTYEKLGIDRLLYDINHFYKNDLEKVNSDILKCINKYKEMGLTKLDFNYSSYCNEYVNILINNKDNEKLIRETFDKIYWKCPEIVTHIELNLKSIYLNNIKHLTKVVQNEDKKYFSHKSKSTMLKEYYEKIKEYNTLLENDKLTLYDKFRTGRLKVKDYKEDTIKKAYNSIIIPNTDIDEYLNNNIKKLAYSLEEYKNYTKFAYIINDICEKYENKDKFKGVYNKLLKDIEKEEKVLFKLNKKAKKIAHSLFKSNKNKEEQLSKINIKIDSLILSLKEKYEQFEESRIDDWILTKLEDRSTYRDALLLASCNYNYMIKVLRSQKEDITLKEAQQIILSLKDFVYSPYNTVINNISITTKKNVPFIISDCYKLLNINIEADDLLDESMIDNLLSNIEIINIANIMNKQNISVNDIEFIIQVDNLNKIRK